MPAGRPTDYDPTKHPIEFIQKSKSGRHIYQIAADWGVDRDTLKEWAKKHPEFSAAKEIGMQLCEAWYQDIGQAALVDQAKDAQGNKIKVDFRFYKWLTQNKFKWAERTENTNDDTVTATVAATGDITYRARWGNDPALKKPEPKPEPKQEDEKDGESPGTDPVRAP